MKLTFKDFFLYLYFFIPLTLITGPAIPDLTITFGGIFGLIWIFLKEKNYELINNSLVRISLAFWLSLILISFFAINKVQSFQDAFIFLRYLTIPICCYYLFFIDKNVLRYLLLSILILVLLVSIDTIYQFFNYSAKDGFGEDLLGFKSDWYGRLTGPFGDELIPGSYVSKLGLIGFAYFLITKNFNYKFILQGVYLSLILIVCFMSGERMAFASFGLALLIMFLFLVKQRLSLFFSIILSLIIIILIFKFHPFYNDYKIIESNQFHQGLKIEKEIQCENDKSKICKKIISIQPSFLEVIKNFRTSAYGEIYLLSYKMFKDNPITGIGISNFKTVCENEERYYKMHTNYYCASHPHNTYIQWLAEGGLIVFFMFISYLFLICRFIINNSGDNEFKIISLILLIILFWPIMSTGSVIKNWYGIIVFFVVGISICLSRIKKNF